MHGVPNFRVVPQTSGKKHYVAMAADGLEYPVDSSVGEVNIPLVSDYPNHPLIQVSTVSYRLKLLFSALPEAAQPCVAAAGVIL